MIFIKFNMTFKRFYWELCELRIVHTSSLNYTFVQSVYVVQRSPTFPCEGPLPPFSGIFYILAKQCCVLIY